MAGMGLFDVKGLTDQRPTFGIGSPLFDRITIKLNSKYYTGRQFVIETENNSSENVYIQSLSLNGSELNKTFIPFSEVVNGGSLKLIMGNQPKDNY
jgi:putative alpha-1,2-mannosidase